MTDQEFQSSITLDNSSGGLTFYVGRITRKDSDITFVNSTIIQGLFPNFLAEPPPNPASALGDACKSFKLLDGLDRIPCGDSFRIHYANILSPSIPLQFASNLSTSVNSSLLRGLHFFLYAGLAVV